MAGVATYAALQTALANQGKRQHLQWTRASISGSVVDVLYDLSLLGDRPAILTTPTAGLANATACSKTTGGAMYFMNAAASTNNFLLKINANRTSGASLQGTYWLVDRLAMCKVDMTTASGSFTGFDATARLAATEGGMIVTTVITALSATPTAISLGYTNQSGTASRTTKTISTTASRAANNSAITLYNFWPLQAGDTGVRSIESYTSDAAGTGVVLFSVVKPLAIFNAGLFGDCYERDAMIQTLKGVIIPDNACLQLLFAPAASSTSAMAADIELFNN